MSDLNLRNQGEFLNALHLFSLFDNKGLKLNEPESLLQEWSKGYQTEDKAHYSFYSLFNVKNLMSLLKCVGENISNYCCRGRGLDSRCHVSLFLAEI